MPRVGPVKPAGKAPRRGADPNSIFQQQMTWCHSRSDCEGQWNWGEPRSWATDEWDDEIEAPLNSLSASTWAEISTMISNGHFKHHSQSIESICKEAQDRWLVVASDIEDAFRFRLNGAKKRAWGYRLGAHFFLIWYERQHKIYLTEKRNT